MPKLDRAQVVQFADDAGFTADEAEVFADIADCESGFDPAKVTRRGDGKVDVGLWGIRAGQRPTWTITWLKDPAHNARAAHTVYQAQTWRAWERSADCWRQKIEARAGLGTGRPYAETPVIGAIPGVGEALDTADAGARKAADTAVAAVKSAGGFLLELPEQLARIAGILQDAGAWISDRENWSRVALVIGGSAVVILSLVVLARPALEPVAETAVKVATKVA